MKFLKKNFQNILFVALLLLLIIPQTRMPIQVFVQRVFSFGPSEIKAENREWLKDYSGTLISLNGDPIKFSETQGEVVVINFWATWCPPCVAEMPSFQKLFDAYNGKVVFLFVSNEKIETLQNFLQKNEYSFPVYTQLPNDPLQLSAAALPTTYVLSKNGEIMIKETGAADWDSENLKNLLNKLLAEEKNQRPER